MNLATLYSEQVEVLLRLWPELPRHILLAFTPNSSQVGLTAVEREKPKKIPFKEIWLEIVSVLGNFLFTRVKVIDGHFQFQDNNFEYQLKELITTNKELLLLMTSFKW